MSRLQNYTTLSEMVSQRIDHGLKAKEQPRIAQITLLRIASMVSVVIVHCAHFSLCRSFVESRFTIETKTIETKEVIALTRHKAVILMQE